jgi:DTW domain-containing protein YfiP
MFEVLFVLLHICFITHKNELHRTTNTGQLVVAESNNNNQFETSIIPWGGRDDNELIDHTIKSFSNDDPILLWTETTTNFSNHDIDNNNNNMIENNRVFIVLDGTWQEAERMYRKGPVRLRSLPKAFISTSKPTRYTLRYCYYHYKQYDIIININTIIIVSITITNITIITTNIFININIIIIVIFIIITIIIIRKNFGYINKYSDKTSNLLCTAEICAEILLREGLSTAARSLLIELDKFIQKKNNDDVR